MPRSAVREEGKKYVWDNGLYSSEQEAEGKKNSIKRRRRKNEF